MRQHLLSAPVILWMRVLLLAAGLWCAIALAQDYPPDPPESPDAPEGSESPGALLPPATRPRVEAVPLRPVTVPPAESAADAVIDDRSFLILGERLLPGTTRRLEWISEQGYFDEVKAPVLVTHGAQPGPVLCLIGGIHGDELNGIEVVRRMIRAIKPEELKGTLVGVPIVNMAGFARGSRYLPDRRDLNRFFPGSPRGSAASRIAYSFFNEIARRCDSIVDFHTGSFERSNLPQVRGDMRIPAVLRFTRGFGDTTVLHTPGAPGMLRRAATDIGIPAVTFELGAPIRLQPMEIEHGVKAMETLLNQLGMVERFRVRRQPQPVYYDSRWVRAGAGGFLFADVALGDQVSAGQRLGRIVDPITHEEHLLTSPFAGRVLGMALNQVVMPGFAAFHIGGRTTEAEALREAIRRQPENLNNLELEEVDAAGEGMSANGGRVRGDSSE